MNFNDKLYSKQGIHSLTKGHTEYVEVLNAFGGIYTGQLRSNAGTIRMSMCLESKARIELLPPFVGCCGAKL
ncbi:unnamed protein product [Cylicocyclus nassatus]|uniref:Uncharacterized protein n=1 Tax=Cylicocyclus nassatus TaxID=53992 RepID=A0AA36DNQ9_CYLNA|nr:unnamed protein product [Cylicocyclus nassatus]